MRTAELDYTVPPELIAQTPADPRDSARLLVCERGTHVVHDRVVRDLPEVLRSGDVLVRNDTRVLAARTHFRRPTGGRLEVLFLEPSADKDAGAPREAGAASGERWEVLVGGRTRPGETITWDGRSSGEPWRLVVEEDLGGGRWCVHSAAAAHVADLLNRCGETPLPPYIKAPLRDGERYQTTYARVPGSAAAPTAGLHFTPSLDARLRERGVEIVALTLHVGLGTFKPITAERVEDHVLHSEPYVVAVEAWRRVRAAKEGGRRVIAVGTTSVRLLEELARLPVTPDRADLCCRSAAGRSGATVAGRTALFITPGFAFRIVDALLTNFHLPRTTLLALVAAFHGIGPTRHAYAHAVAQRYRFYSFGDAMLVA